jgi:hypothetical protein
MKEGHEAERRVTMASQRKQAIRERAYAIWEQEGRPDGKDLDHWLGAEAETAISHMYVHLKHAAFLIGKRIITFLQSQPILAIISLIVSVGGTYLNFFWHPESVLRFILVS